jgi:large subunit ribosomal protein L24
LNVKTAEGQLAIGAGQIRLTDAKASGEGADLAMSGVFDLTNGTLSARLVLTGTDTVAGARPDIFVALNGPLGTLGKTIDVSGLTGWLTLRAIDQQSKKLDAIEVVPQPEPKAEAKPEQKPETKTEAAPPVVPPRPKEPAVRKPPGQPRAVAPPSAPVLPPPINILPRVDPPPAR